MWNQSSRCACRLTKHLRVYQDPANGQSKVLIPFMISYFLFEVLFIVPQFMPDMDLAGKQILQSLSMIHPAVALSGGMTSLISNSILPVSEYFSPASPFAWDVTTRSIVLLALVFGVGFALLLHFEQRDGACAGDRDPYVFVPTNNMQGFGCDIDCMHSPATDMLLTAALNPSMWSTLTLRMMMYATSGFTLIRPILLRAT